MSWLDKILPPKIKREDKGASAIPEGLWSNALHVQLLYTLQIYNKIVMSAQNVDTIMR